MHGLWLMVMVGAVRVSKFFCFCAGQRFIAALSHTGGQARKNLLEVRLRL